MHVRWAFDILARYIVSLFDFQYTSPGSRLAVSCLGRVVNLNPSFHIANSVREEPAAYRRHVLCVAYTPRRMNARAKLGDPRSTCAGMLFPPPLPPALLRAITDPLRGLFHVACMSLLQATAKVLDRLPWAFHQLLSLRSFPFTSSLLRASH